MEYHKSIRWQFKFTAAVVAVPDAVYLLKQLSQALDNGQAY